MGPEVFIPSELTGNQIERAFIMAGTKQAVPEINELLKYLEFTATREGEPWLLLEDGHFKPTENCIKQLKDLLSTEDLFNESPSQCLCSTRRSFSQWPTPFII